MDSDRIAGKAKEAEGKLTGDSVREHQGEAQGTLGKVKDEAREGWEKSKEVGREMKDKVSDMVSGDDDANANANAERH